MSYSREQVATYLQEQNMEMENVQISELKMYSSSKYGNHVYIREDHLDKEYYFIINNDETKQYPHIYYYIAGYFPKEKYLGKTRPDKSKVDTYIYDLDELTLHAQRISLKHYTNIVSDKYTVTDEDLVDEQPVRRIREIMPGFEPIDLIRSSLTPKEYQGYLKGMVLKKTLNRDDEGADFYRDKIKELNDK
jgi:hypothetical protein